jgi:nucleotide-binding universal stress UspA family protein
MPAPMAPTDRAGETSARRTDGEPPGREILVGVDGTEVGLGAVRWAAQEAARRDAPLKILHAAPYIGQSGPTGEPPPELPRARGITAVAYTVARRNAAGVPATTEVDPDEPVEALLRGAAGSQLVVLGSSTTGAADEMVLATIAARVAGRSPVPVVVVPRRRGPLPTGRPVVAILGVGERADDEAVALFAATAAQQTEVPLELLQTRPAQHNVAASWVDDDGAWAGRFPGLDVQRSELLGARANQVLGAACPSPLLVISAGHGTLLHRSLDGPHRWLLRHCTSPMALVPSVGQGERDTMEDVPPSA